MDNRAEALSESQKEILEKFKENLSDILRPHHTDSILQKFLKAKNYNLKKAERIFRQVDFGKKVYGIEKLPETFIKTEVEKKYEVTNRLGFAKDGTLVKYEAVGKLDIMGFIMSESCYRLCLLICYIIESDLALSKEQSEKVGREINEITYIFDLDGSSVRQIAHKGVIESIVDFLSTVQDIYPSIWRRVLVINVPFAFHKVFNMFRHFLGSSLLEKFEIIAPDSTSEVLLQYIDEDVLPAFLGGKRTDSKGDPKCLEFIRTGGAIPEEYYSRNHVHLLMPSDPNVKSIVIRARSAFNYSLVAKEVGSTFHFEFRTEDGSLKAAVLLKNFGSNTENPALPADDEILDETDENSGVLMICVGFTAQTHLTQTPLVGKVISPGIYILRLDNRSSWFTSRKVFLRARLLPPEG